MRPAQPASRYFDLRRFPSLAGALDEAGYNVAGHAGHMLELRAAVNERISAGRPLLKDFDGALAALTITDVENPKVAAAKLAVGTAFVKRSVL